ncbi:MAG: DUF354 domain-containing protein [Candidatus Asgardarchaeia archaeon]
MPKVWIDILTPKQVLFFSKIAEKLNERKIEVIFTTREYREVLDLLKLKNIDATVIGKHGGKDLKSKLIQSAERILNLTEWVSKIKPDVALSFSSPEASRVAFGLGIPHFAVNDSPHSIFVAKLSLPLSTKLFASRYISVRKWVRYGISIRDIITYNAIDQAAWLKEFKPDRRVLDTIGLLEDKPILTIREAETWASYYPENETIITSIIRKLIKTFNYAQIVIVPRYQEQVIAFKKMFNLRNVFVLDRIVDTTSLLYFTDVFIGSGGTMNGEAALLGVPNISTYPNITLDINKFLIKEGLLVKTRNIKKIIDFSKYALESQEFRVKLKRKAQRILERMDNPAIVIADFINNYLSK